MRRPLIVGVVAAVVVGLVWALVAQLSGETPTAGTERPAPHPAVSPSAPAKSLLTDPSAKSAAEFQAIYEELQDMVTRAFNEHRPELLDEVFGPDCPVTCRVAERKEAIRQMATSGARLKGYEPRVRFVEVIHDSTDVILEGRPSRTVGLRLVDEQEPYSVVRPDASVLERSGGWTPRSNAYSLYFSGASRRWRIFEFEIEGSADDLLGTRWRESANGR